MNFSFAIASSIGYVSGIQIPGTSIIYTNASITKGIEMLNKRQLAIIIGFIRSELLAKVERLIETDNIEKNNWE